MGAAPSVAYRSDVISGQEQTAAAGHGTATRAGPVIAAVRPVVSARTWLAVIHLVTGWFISLVVFAIVVTALSVGLALVPIALTGVPILWALVLLCGLFARAERGRFALMLGERIPDPPARDPRPATGVWQRVRRRLTAPETWRPLGYALLRLPLSTLQSALVIGVWALALAMIAFPGYNGILPRGSTILGGHAPLGAAETAALTAGGLVLLLAAPQLTRGLAIVDIAVARLLLGPPRRADLRARIGELELSRARVVDSAETERRKIERDLHDGAQQRLVALAMDLGRAKARFADDPEAARPIVDQAHAEAKAALVELRNLVRGRASPGPDRPRPGRRPVRPGRAQPCPGLRAGGRRAEAVGIGRGHRLLRGRRGAHQRRQACPRDPRRGIGRAARRRAHCRDPRRRGRWRRTARHRACPASRTGSPAWTAGCRWTARPAPAPL